MHKFYRLTPKPGAWIESHTSVFEKTWRGVRGWLVEEEYEDFVYAEEPPCARIASATVDVANSQPVSTQFVFDDGYSESEQERIRNAWESVGRELLTDDRWKIEEDYYRLQGPVDVEVVDA
jgi:hypothetical protein